MNLPPYLSRTPPPLNNEDDDNADEEFGTFVVSSDLGEEVYEVFDRASCVLKGEDNVSEDSGFCMNSFGQTQSPCDISPLSSSYPNKGNESVNDDTPESTVIDCPLNVTNSITENKTINNEEPITINSSPEAHGMAFSSITVKENHGSLSHEKNTCQTTFISSNEDVVANVNDSKSDTDDNSVHDTENKINPESPSLQCNPLSSFHELTISNETNDCHKLKHSSENACENITDITADKNFPNQIHSGSPITSSSDVENGIINGVDDEYLPIACNNTETNEQAREIADDSINDWGSDDEFSEFAEFQSSSNFVDPIITTETVPDFDSTFPLSAIDENADVNICTLQSAVQSNMVWNFLQCFEETSACKYQWSTSCSNMKFLHALQIDSRNIFHGPWSKINKLNWSDVPSHYDSSTFSSHFSETRRPNSKLAQPEPSIPDAHFDWVSSGLINPLQPTNNQHHTTEVQGSCSSQIINNKMNDILESLPTLTFIKAHYIVFKRD